MTIQENAMNETISHSISPSSHKVEIRYEDTILCKGFIANLLYCVMAEQMGFDSDNIASFWERSLPIRKFVCLCAGPIQLRKRLC